MTPHATSSTLLTFIGTSRPGATTGEEFLTYFGRRFVLVMFRLEYNRVKQSEDLQTKVWPTLIIGGDADDTAGNRVFVIAAASAAVFNEDGLGVA